MVQMVAHHHLDLILLVVLEQEAKVVTMTVVGLMLTTTQPHLLF
jgi:hypothetical protein